MLLGDAPEDERPPIISRIPVLGRIVPAVLAVPSHLYLTVDGSKPSKPLEVVFVSSDPAFVLEVKPAESNESDLVFEKSKDSRNNKFAIARTAKPLKKNT